MLAGMRNLLVTVLVNAGALWLASFLLSGISFTSSTSDTKDLVIAVVVVAVLFTLVNAVVKPITTFLAMPAILLSLGLFLLVINALMLQLTSWLSGQLHLGFHVERFFWDAILGGLIVSISTMVMRWVLGEDKRQHA